MDMRKLNNEADAVSSIEKRKRIHPLRASPLKRTPMVNTFYMRVHFLILEKKRLIKLIYPMTSIE